MDNVTLSAAEATEVVERVRELVYGLKTLEVLANKGDQDAAELLSQCRMLMRSRIARL